MDRPALSKWIRSPRDYWKLGPVYIWKSLVLVFLGLAAVGVLMTFGLPWTAGLSSQQGQTIPTYRYNDPELQEATGAVCILDDLGRVRYKGQVAAGSCTGQGKVYDEEGQLVYDGPLVDGIYEGENAKVYADGVLIYEGMMAANRYEGRGRFIDPDTGIVSQGTFVAGIFEGEGQQFYADGTLMRSGTFSNGLLNGEGREYSPLGVLLREGTFQDGLLHGEGVQYTTGGILNYQGEFASGIFHGQGALYDTLEQSRVYEGAFVWGKATGSGRIYHPGGQLLFEGQVCEGQPRASAFLGLSLAEVEAAFTEHWQLYSYGEVTAFVYPYFHLMFITEVPVQLISPIQQQDRTEQERQELLEAIAVQAQQSAQAQESYGEQSAAEFPIAGEKSSTLASAEPMGDMVLSPDTVKSDVLISEVLSYAVPLAGVAQPDSNLAAGTRETGWRAWFSDFAAGETFTGAAVLQTGPFVYEFTSVSTASPAQADYYLASGGGVESTTVFRTWKDSPLWYQSAIRMDDEI